MSRYEPERRRVLVFSGHDPSGGAGLHADIESISQCGCHTFSVVTLLTVQTIAKMSRCYNVDFEQFSEVATAIFKSQPLHAIKIGAVADVRQVKLIAELLDQYRGVVIFDPVIAPTYGEKFADDSVIAAVKTHLLPKVTLFIPNVDELRYYAGCDDISQAIGEIKALGCCNILLSSAAVVGDKLRHILFGREGETEYYSNLLAGVYRGSGCTLAAAVSAYMAKDLDLRQAIHLAIAYVTETVAAADQCQDNVFLPRRILL